MVAQIKIDPKYKNMSSDMLTEILVKSGEDHADNEDRSEAIFSKSESSNCQEHDEEEHFVKMKKSLDYSAREYMEKLEFLDGYFDEDYIREMYLENNLRCASFTQSYNILHNHDFQEAGGALERADIL